MDDKLKDDYEAFFQYIANQVNPKDVINSVMSGRLMSKPEMQTLYPYQKKILMELVDVNYSEAEKRLISTYYMPDAIAGDRFYDYKTYNESLSHTYNSGTMPTKQALEYLNIVKSTEPNERTVDINKVKRKRAINKSNKRKARNAKS